MKTEDLHSLLIRGIRQIRGQNSSAFFPWRPHVFVPLR